MLIFSSSKIRERLTGAQEVKRVIMWDNIINDNITP